MANDKKALLPLIVALVASLLCFCSPLPAFADDAVDDSPAYEVWQQYQESSVSEFNLYKKVVEDLAYRWFMADSAKRAKVPLQSVALGSYKQLTQYAEDYETSEQQWQAFYDDFHPSFMVRMYSLVTYEDSLSTWSVSDNYAYQHYKEWYEWFEGSSSGGGGVEDDGEYVLIPLVHLYDFGSSYPALDGVRYCKVAKSDWDYVADYAEQNNQLMSAYIYVNHSKLVVQSYVSGSIDWSVASQGWKGTVEQSCAVFEWLYSIDGDTLVMSANPNKWIGIYRYPIGGPFNGPMPLGNTNVGSYETVSPVNPVYPEPETPSKPTVDNPIYIDNDTSTTTADLQPILDAIRAINDNLIAGFDMLQEEIEGWMDSVTGWLEKIWRELRTANSWLERIFYKTGGGSSDGPDITIDGDGWWSWLSTIAGILLGDLAGAVSGLSGAFDMLRGLFPFSIPWDLAALLGLFASEPVTPVFDLPVPFGFANGTLQSASVHVDLSAWDGVMVAVRSVELAIFALGLALKTRELLKNAEVEQ